MQLRIEAVVLGRDKWLGGELGCDGCIYGIPGEEFGRLDHRPIWKRQGQGGPRRHSREPLGMFGKFEGARGLSTTHPPFVAWGFHFCFCRADKKVITFRVWLKCTKLVKNKHQGHQRLNLRIVSQREVCASGGDEIGGGFSTPGSASRVLKVDGSRVELIGPELAGKFKWPEPRGVSGSRGLGVSESGLKEAVD